MCGGVGWGGAALEREEEDYTGMEYTIGYTRTPAYVIHLHNKA